MRANSAEIYKITNAGVSKEANQPTWHLWNVFSPREGMGETSQNVIIPVVDTIVLSVYFRLILLVCLSCIDPWQTLQLTWLKCNMPNIQTICGAIKWQTNHNNVQQSHKDVSCLKLKPRCMSQTWGCLRPNLDNHLIIVIRHGAALRSRT